MDNKTILALSASLLFASVNSQAEINHEIVLSIEEPGEGSLMTGVSNLRGWAVAPVKIDRIEWFLDGEAKGVIPYGGDRDDVGQQYPQFPDSGLSGYSSALNYSLLSSGSHTLRIRAVDVTGDHNELTTTFNVTAFKSPFIREPDGVSIKDASVSQQGETILLNNVSADGDTYNIVLEWRPATQSFYPTDIALLADNDGNQALVVIPNQAPKAVNDAITVIQDSNNNSIDVLANDTDPEGDTLAIASVTNPGHGTAVIDHGKISYTPAPGFSGSDQFSYTVNDGNNGQSTASVTITIEAQAVISKIPDVRGSWSIQATLSEGSCFLTDGSAEYVLDAQEDANFSGTVARNGETVAISGQVDIDGQFNSSDDVSVSLLPGCIVTTQIEGNFLTGAFKSNISGFTAACSPFLDACQDAVFTGTISRK